MSETTEDIVQCKYCLNKDTAARVAAGKCCPPERCECGREVEDCATFDDPESTHQDR